MLKVNIILIIILLTVTLGLIYYFKINKKTIGDIKKEGFVLHRQFLDSQYCDRIMMTVNTEMFNKKKEEFFTNGSNRKNIALPLDENIKPIISIICKKVGILSEYKNPVLVECGIKLSYPNANKSNWINKNNNIKTYLVNLDKNTTQVYSGSHVNKKSKEIVNIDCDRGDMFVLDNRIIKREIENDSKIIKPVFYFSVKEDNEKDNNKDNIYALKSEYRGKVNLKKIL